jgi:hypothetical protein
MNVSLGPWANWVEVKVRGRRFANKSEVLRWCCRVVDSLERGAGPPGATFRDARELQTLLLEGLDSGPARPMTTERRKAIYAALDL